MQINSKTNAELQKQFKEFNKNLKTIEKELNEIKDITMKTLRDDIRKKKSKKQEFGPLSVDPYPPTKVVKIMYFKVFPFCILVKLSKKARDQFQNIFNAVNMVL